MSNEHNPVFNVQWIPVEKVKANDYNPNSVASKEMKLLYISIKNDGYTQPVVTIHDKEKDEYVIVDGFHRYTIMKTKKDIYDLNDGLLPVVVLNKNINDRMASTVRHNRARGKHSVGGMSNMVFQLLQSGESDQDICFKLGLEKDELKRLKYVTGFAKLFSKVEYSNAWETESQIEERKKYEQASRG